LYGNIKTELSFGYGIGLDCRALVVRLFLSKMVVQYLSRETLVCGKRFDIPRDSRTGGVLHYELDRDYTDGNYISFLMTSPTEARKVVLSRWRVLDGAASVEFKGVPCDDKFCVGAPIFYDDRGNILKTGNR